MTPRQLYLAMVEAYRDGAPQEIIQDMAEDLAALAMQHPERPDLSSCGRENWGALLSGCAYREARGDEPAWACPQCAAYCRWVRPEGRG